jgi:hypothetical protein
MRQVREVLRLKFVGGVPTREIARPIGVAASTVRATLRRLRTAGLSWPLPEEMTDAALEAALFANAGTKQGHRRRGEPDWAVIHRELERKHVTLLILWDEHIEREPEGYRYSRVCELRRRSFRAFHRLAPLFEALALAPGDRRNARLFRWRSQRPCTSVWRTSARSRVERSASSETCV